jgi:hypothetical protein
MTPDFGIRLSEPARLLRSGLSLTLRQAQGDTWDFDGCVTALVGFAVERAHVAFAAVQVVVPRRRPDPRLRVLVLRLAHDPSLQAAPGGIRARPAPEERLYTAEAAIVRPIDVENALCKEPNPVHLHEGIVIPKRGDHQSTLLTFDRDVMC